MRWLFFFVGGVLMMLSMQQLAGLFIAIGGFGSFFYSAYMSEEHEQHKKY